MDCEVWDIILSAVAILTSIIAIGISLCVASKQNKIALFEKRYEIYSDALDFFECAYNYTRAYLKTRNDCTISTKCR